MRLDISVRFAPCSESQALAVRQGLDTLDDETRLLVRESFAPDAFANGGRGAVFRLGHEDETVGHVVCIAARDGWYHADVRVNVPDDDEALCARVRREVVPGARVSPGFFSIDAYRHDGARVVRHRSALLDDISILGRNDVPGYVGATVVSVEQPKGRLVDGVWLRPGDELVDHRNRVIARG